MIGLDEYAGRVRRCRELLAEREMDALALSLGADMAYFCGYRAVPLERLTLLVIGTYGEPTLLVPELEAHRVAPLDGVFEIVPWSDAEDSVALAVRQLRVQSGARPTIGASERMWARHLLAFQGAMQHARFIPAERITRPLRIRKSPAEVEALRAAARAADTVAASLPTLGWAGRTEAEIAGDIARALRAEGHETVNFVIVASGPNGASPHHDPGRRVLQSGDVVVVDFGGTRDGYCSDVTRCVAVGEPSRDVAEAYAVVAAAQQEAVGAVRPGVSAGDVDAAARDVLAAAGHAEHFVHRTGHGIGLEEHEAPDIVAGSPEPLAPGMCFSVEPGVYVPGRFGLRLEDVVLTTDTGVERLNTAPRDLVVVAG